MMSNAGERKKKPVLRALVVLVMLLIVVIGALAVGNQSLEYHRCVQLKNGLSLGYNAAFDLNRPYWRRIAVPKFSDGTPLVDYKVWPLYITDTTLYGYARGETGKQDFEFVWRADWGLVREDEDPETYEKLISEAGPANVGLGSGILGTGILMERLERRPEHANQKCRTQFFTW